MHKRHELLFSCKFHHHFPFFITNRLSRKSANSNQRHVCKSLIFFYHSNEGTDIVGIAKVIKEAYQDPTTDDDRWSAVDLKPVRKLKKSVTLETIKKDKRLANMALVRIGRLSTQPVSDKEWEVVMELAGEK